MVDIIVAKRLEKYLYYPVWNYDFTQFAKKINWFCDNYNSYAIIHKLAKKEEAKTIDHLLKKEETTTKISREQKRKRRRY